MKKLFSEIPYIETERLTLRKITDQDSEGLDELRHSTNVYRYLPTFLFEQKYEDIHYVIQELYHECFRESIILGVFQKEAFCGLAEMYGFKEHIHKISVGYRFLERYWGLGIATESLKGMINYLYGETDTEIITASTMVENQASASVLRKNGFSLVASHVGEDWGYPEPTIADKWIR